MILPSCCSGNVSASLSPRNFYALSFSSARCPPCPAQLSSPEPHDSCTVTSVRSDTGPLREDIKIARKQFQGRARDLKDVPIHKMQEAFQKMAAMLKKCKKAKTGDEIQAVREFIAGVDPLEQTIFQPILNEYRNANIGFTEYLTSQLRDSFKNSICSRSVPVICPQCCFSRSIFKTVPDSLLKNKLSLFSKVDVRGLLKSVNSLLDKKLPRFTIIVTRVRSLSSGKKKKQLDLREPRGDDFGVSTFLKRCSVMTL
ncbi:hypothetical protein NEOLEDRAFT_1129110 [Neolentinus lepideus HHB14362 ss-1]|uniref:Uncharacterized protein n=1 Tax=Neolentinus lepideus HHB14362 ss-1 TaxID=1314782 RepID=A0A165UXN0_9AGAM|nr:hypothetical protein NEOLEDRAFT_1129110 [Neolentinus lepideus HHB14362 ss-1]